MLACLRTVLFQENLFDVAWITLGSMFKALLEGSSDEIHMQNLKLHLCSTLHAAASKAIRC